MTSDAPIEQPPALDFSATPLVPAIITDAASGEVLMLGYMNAEAYAATRRSGLTHFWSRSRKKLWRKGEVSGHEQQVRSIAVNCELNALLIAVEQTGAVCHTGHPTCFYRNIQDDESLSEASDRLFDPEVVYGGQPEPTRRWFGAYAWLRDQPIVRESRTSRILHDDSVNFASRVADELRELAGVLAGEHHHRGLQDDVLAEGSQVLYWLALAAVADNLDWEAVRPDRAIDVSNGEANVATMVRLLRIAAESWGKTDRNSVLPERVHASMSLVAQAASMAGLSGQELVAHDLQELRAKPYLTPYFDED